MQLIDGENTLKGLVATEFSTRFVYYSKFKLDSLIGQLDLTKANIVQGNYFNKPAGVNLKAKVNVGYNNDVLQVKDMNLQFHKLKAVVSGQMSPGPKSSELSLAIANTPLKGFESYFPMLETSPLNGAIGLNSRISGDLGDVKSLKFKIKNYFLKNVSTYLKFESKDKSIIIDGPLKFSASGSALIEGGTLSENSSSFNLKGKDLLVEVKDKFYKKSGSELYIDGEIEKNGSKYKIDSLNTKLSGLSLATKGSVELEGDSVKFAVSNQIQEMNKQKLENLFPDLLSFKESPKISGKINWSGTYKKGMSMETLPISLKGGLFVNMPIIKIDREVPVNAENANPLDLPPPESILPNWPLFKKADLQVKLYMDHFYYGSYHLSDLQLNTLYKDGDLSLNGEIRKTYGGKIKIGKLKVNLLKPSPSTIYAVNVFNLNMKPFIDQNFPEYSGAVDGVLSLSLKGRTPYPGSPGWKEKIIGKGSLQLINADLKTFQFDELVNEELVKITGLGSKQVVNTRGVSFKLTTGFSMSKGKIFFKKFDILTPENNQLNCEGYIDLELNCSLDGNVYLSKAPVRGSVFLANRDKQGRFMAPVQIRGNLLKPSFVFARETVDQLISRALRYETLKVREKARDELERRAIIEKENLKKKIKNKVKGVLEL